MLAFQFLSLVVQSAFNFFSGNPQTPLATKGVAFYDPNSNGGSMLDNAGDGYGEPLNVIISALSSPAVLTDAGLLNFAQAVGLYGSHPASQLRSRITRFQLVRMSSPTPRRPAIRKPRRRKRLGQPNRRVFPIPPPFTTLTQTTLTQVELRWDFGSSEIGTCLESLVGGNHFRVFRQNGTEANSGALFLAVSQEEDVEEGHTIIQNGYNVGRNAMVAAATGNTKHDGVSYHTTAQNITGLLAPGSEGVNHGVAQDGITTLLTVTIL
ncbi:hypothetical protein HMN09_00197600 [Mycena chlorophos]|uniref:Uncharacterized protein n=1 Tax=Mycena chlorophos TaxID=658473 RepID=A0A8H6WQS0_MYCCL|nr:hypothetical protein HMN09_00197600 [Mycena chlorophos]